MNLENRLILLVEDNEDDAELARRAFNKIGVDNRMVVAADGEAALDYLFARGAWEGRDLSETPRVVLLDLNLPRIGGLEVLRRVRANETTRRLPVVILTTSVEERDIATSYDLGANGYVRKPVSFGDFAEAARQLGVYWLRLNEPPPGAAA